MDFKLEEEERVVVDVEYGIEGQWRTQGTVIGTADSGSLSDSDGLDGQWLDWPHTRSAATGCLCVVAAVGVG